MNDPVQKLEKAMETITKPRVAKEEGEGLMKLYTAAIMKKNPEEIERRRQDSLAHYEYTLDLMKELLQEL